MKRHFFYDTIVLLSIQYSLGFAKPVTKLTLQIMVAIIHIVPIGNMGNAFDKNIKGVLVYGKNLH